MGDKDGKQVLMCSWGKKSDPALGMDFNTGSDKIVSEEDRPKEVSIFSLFSADLGAFKRDTCTKLLRRQTF